MIYRDLIGDLIDIFARIIRKEKKVFTGTIIELDWKLIPEIFGTFKLNRTGFVGDFLFKLGHLT